MCFNVWPDVFGLSAKEVSKDTLLAVKVEDGICVFGRYFQAVPKGLWLVVFPLDEVLARHVVLAIQE